MYNIQVEYCLDVVMVKMKPVKCKPFAYLHRRPHVIGHYIGLINIHADFYTHAMHLNKYT